MSDLSYTLHELQLLASASVPTQVSLALLFAGAADDILKQVDVAIDHIAQEFARNPKERKDRSEDGLSIDVVTSLRDMGFQAYHDTKIGGHCDIVIEGRYNFLWLGEAKIHRSYDWLLQGFNQLDTRYATSSKYQDRGGIIIYCLGSRVDRIMEEWAVRLKEGRPDVEISIGSGDDVFFTSSHVHIRTGRPYQVRHVPISLHWDPSN